MVDLYYAFHHKDQTIIVPVPELTEDQRKENMMNFGNSYGVMRIAIFEESQKSFITSNEIVQLAEDYAIQHKK